MMNPKAFTYSLIFILLSACTYQVSSQPSSDTLRTYDIRSVTVSARRALADIGSQKTVVDTSALREDITRSLADVLSTNSSIFIKSYGRGSLSTASFRGTSPSHTRVTWNGVEINSPMLGMVDFSLIPSYFVDDLTLYHGASSVGVTGGGLGGAVTLTTKPVRDDGFGLKYIQGLGSYHTYDEFARLSYGGRNLSASTRFLHSRSRNDFKYTNYDKKEFIYDEDYNITGWSYPRDRNRNGGFRDIHIMQDVFVDLGRNNKLDISAWYMDSDRGIPMLKTDYRGNDRSENNQREKTFRGTASWQRLGSDMKLSARGGYTYSQMEYLMLADNNSGTLVEKARSNSYIHTIFGKGAMNYYVGSNWMFEGEVAVYQHLVNSIDQRVRVGTQQEKVPVGYDQGRLELSFFASAKYRPSDLWGLALNLREIMYGDKWSSLIPAFHIDYLISRIGNLVAKASVTRNYRFPTLNDLYFMPGGNPELRPEKGFSYDVGLGTNVRKGIFDIQAEATFYDSYISDWILWRGSEGGWWSPVNVRRVHSYGVELKAGIGMIFGNDWILSLDGNYTLTKAISKADQVNWYDQARGKQLIYIPVHSGNVNGSLGWKGWGFAYRFSSYSERYTTSSNDAGSVTGRLLPYYMSDVSLEKGVSLSWAELNLKLTVNNIFNEEYESVLKRPMAGRNYGFFIEITPRFRSKPITR